MGKPITISTLEEDFRKIGLMTEGCSSKKEGEGDPDDAGCPDCKPGEPCDKHKENPPAAAEGCKGKKEDTDGAGDPLDEARIVKKHRKDSQEKMQARKAKQIRKRQKSVLRLKAKKYRKSAQGKRLIKKHAKIVARLGGTKTGKRIMTAGLEQVAASLAEAQRCLEGITTNENELMTGYAELAIVAEMVSERLATLAETADADFKEDMVALSITMMEAAEEAAEIAEDFEEFGAILDEDENVLDMEEDFKALFAVVLEGLEVYAAKTEGKPANP